MKTRAVFELFEVEGQVVPEPREVRTVDPAPAADGRYYATAGENAGDDVWTLFERGVDVHCDRCGSPLEITRAHIVCSKDPRHFHVIG